MVDFNKIGEYFNKATTGIQDASKEGGAFATGVVAGIPKGIVDAVASPVTVGASLLGHLTGNEELRKVNDNYEHLFFNPKTQSGLTVNAYKAISGKQNLTPEEMNALGVGQVVSGVATPGMLGKTAGLLKGGAVGNAGALMNTLPEVLQLNKARNLGAAMLPDDFVKGAAGAYKGAKEFAPIKNVANNQQIKNVIQQIDPRSATERVLSEDSGAIGILKKELNAPEAVNLKDFGDAAIKRFNNSPIDESLNIIENQLKRNKVSKESIALIKEELKGSMEASRSTQSLNYAQQHFNNQLNKLGRSDIRISDEAVVKAANNLVSFYEKEITNLYAKDKFDAAKLAESSFNTKIEKVYDSIKKKNPELANQFANNYNPAWTSNISRLSMMFNPGAAAQDALSFQLNSRNSVIDIAKNAGIEDFALVEKNITPAWKRDKWLENPAHFKLIQRELIDPTRSIMSGFDPLKETNIKNIVKGGKVKEVIKQYEGVLPKLFEDALYGIQQGTREKLVESFVVPRSIALARATPGLIEGTERFNKAVINYGKEILRKNSMLKETKYGTFRDAQGNYTAIKNWNEGLTDTLKKMPVAGKDFAAGANTLTGWISNQMRAFNAAPDAIGDVLNRVQKTGKVTAIDKQQLVQSMSDIFFTAAMYGARGLRLTGAGMTLPKMITGGNPMDMTTSEQTVPSLILNTVLDLMQTDPNLRQEVSNGLIGNFLGGVPSNIINAPDPVTQITLGSEIAKAKTAQWYKSAPDIIVNLRNGDVKGAVQAFANSIISKDIKAVAQAKTQEGTGNEIIDSRGNSIAPDFARNNNFTETTSTGDELLGLLKIGQPAIKDASSIGKASSDYSLSQDDKFVEKYSKYSLEQLKDNFANIKKDLQKFDPEYQEKILEKAVTKIVENSTSSSFKAIKSKVGEYSELTTTELSNIPEIRRLSNKELGEIIGYAALTNNERVADVLFKSGKLTSKNRDEVRDIAKKLIEKKQNETAFRLFKEIPKEEEEPQPTPNPEELDDDEYVEIPDDEEDL